MALWDSNPPPPPLLILVNMPSSRATLILRSLTRIVLTFKLSSVIFSSSFDFSGLCRQIRILLLKGLESLFT